MPIVLPRFLQSYSLWISVLLAFPTFVMLATWNLLPGQLFYNVKLGVEEVPRLALGQSKAAADYEVAIADRRFSEATTLVKSDNTLGLSQLQTSLKTAEQKVIQTQNEQAREQLLTNLIAYNQKLETQKQMVMVVYVQNSSGAQGQTPPSPPLVPTTVQTTAQPAMPPTATTQTPPPTYSYPANNTNAGGITTTPTTVRPSTQQNSTETNTTQTIQSITETQKEIDQIIQNLDKSPEKPGRNFPSKKSGKDHPKSKNED